MSSFMAIMAAARDLQQLLEEEGYSDSDILGALESETDVLAVLDRVVEKTIADQRLAVSATERARRLKERADRRLQLVDLIMRTLKRDRIERPLATVYYQKNPDSADILNPDEVPEDYRTSAPDKARILQMLKSGATVNWAVLKPVSHHIRMKVT